MQEQNIQRTSKEIRSISCKKRREKKNASKINEEQIDEMKKVLILFQDNSY